MADKAHAQTDKLLEEMERHLSAIYRRAQKELQEKADAYFDRFQKADQKQKDLLDAGKISKKEYRDWRLGRMAGGRRYRQMQEQIANELLHVNETAQAYINGQLPEVYALNYNALEGTVDGLEGYSFTLTDQDTVRNLATKDETLLPYREVDGVKDVRWNTKQINAEILQGILQGESIPKIAKRMINITDRNKATAVRSARTCVTSAENKGRQDSYLQAEADGLILEKEWISSDQPGRTRDWHMPGAFEKLSVGIHDSFVNAFGKIRYPGDPTAAGANVWNCRCTMAAHVVGFRKKGETA